MPILRRHIFTLVEMIVVVAIMLLVVGVVISAFRGEEPTITLRNTSLELQSYLARVRYRAAETGRDYVVKYLYGGKELSASPDYSRAELEKIEIDNEVVIEELKFKIPASCKLITESGAEALLGSTDSLEIFRFYPDGGGSSANRVVLKCGELSKSFDIAFLTGRVVITDEDFSESYVPGDEPEEVVAEEEAIDVI